MCAPGLSASSEISFQCKTEEEAWLHLRDICFKPELIDRYEHRLTGTSIDFGRQPHQAMQISEIEQFQGSTTSSYLDVLLPQWNEIAADKSAIAGFMSTSASFWFLVISAKCGRKRTL